jgi:hypothetical protein
VISESEYGDTQSTPWRPPSLATLSDDELSSHLYVVIEEEIDDVVGILVSPWPRSDSQGRLHFHFDELEIELGVDRDALEARLSERSVPESVVAAADGGNADEELRERPIAVGDTFAIRSSQLPDSADELPSLVDEIGIGDWIETIIDLTADARHEAKAAMYRALTPPLKAEVAEELLSVPQEEEAAEQ